MNPYHNMYNRYGSNRDTELIDKIIELALEEDLGQGDISTTLLNLHQHNSKAEIVAKQSGVISGIEIARTVVQKADPNVNFEAFFHDGDEISRGDLILRLDGNTNTLLETERTMLNFLQRMSGIATETRKYVQATKNSHTVIVDTRKTAPGLRVLDKMAVVHGHGTNHRKNLADMVMFKDNHLQLIQESQRSLKQIIASARLQLPISMKIEIEAATLEEVQEALEANPDVIMLDNMSLEMMEDALRLIGGKCLVEASGNMTLERIPKVAALGVDFISVGALTHSVKAFDMSMNFR